jgi:hypothetical protein
MNVDKNWKLNAVRSRAASLGFRIQFVRRTFGPLHVQNRVYINGRRCHLMAGLSRDARERGDRRLAEPQASVNDWAEFVIYVPQPLDDGPLLIVPRDRLSKVGLQTADQFLEYADRWHLLNQISGSRPRTSSGE